jgi:hypothetical protein
MVHRLRNSPFVEYETAVTVLEGHHGWLTLLTPTESRTCYPHLIVIFSARQKSLYAYMGIPTGTKQPLRMKRCVKHKFQFVPSKLFAQLADPFRYCQGSRIHNLPTNSSIRSLPS